MKLTPATSAAYEFACHSSACRPPTSGGTGGSSKGGSKTPHQQAVQKLLNSKVNPVKAAMADRALGRTPKKKGSYSEFRNS
jgi:hypothetical protein